MALNINQFALSTIQGTLDLQPGIVLSAQVDAAQATPLIPGQAVKMAATAGGVPKVLGVTSNTDPVWGFVVYNVKDQSDPASAPLEIALPNSVMRMTANAAIARQGKVQLDYANTKVGPADGVTPTIGYAIDKATANGDLIRVYIQDSSASGNAVRTAKVTATLAQINAGQVLIPGAAGKAITVLDYTARVVGGFASGTAVVLESTNATPVVVTTLAEAGLTNGAVLLPPSANTTLGAGFGAPLGTGDGLQVVNSGSAQTGGTSITFTITYTQS